MQLLSQVIRSSAVVLIIGTPQESIECGIIGKNRGFEQMGAKVFIF